MDSESMVPVTGELLSNETDVDTLLEAYQFLGKVAREVSGATDWIRERLGELAQDSTAKTRRIRGRKFRAVLTMPDNRMDQPKLKEAWNSYPQHRDSVLKIGVIDLKRREWSKVEQETGPVDFMTFRQMVSAAILPPTGLPRVTIEVGPDSDEPAKQADAAREPAESELF